MGSAIPAARLRRSWPQRFLITFNCILIAMCVMAASAVGYSYYRFGNIPRVALGDLLADRPPGEPQNYLLVGSDSREFVTGGDDLKSFGDTTEAGTQKADTIILVRIDPQTETADMTSFPRDLWVTIAGTGGEKQRINTAFADGPAQLIETIELNFNIPIHHYAQVDFEGFRELVNAIGGVEVYFEHQVRDRDIDGNNVSGLDIDQTGCVTLDGDTALSYVRSRHFEEFVDGRWQPDLSSDIGRITRQQDFVATAVRQALEEGLFNPAKFNSLVGVAERHLTLDDELDPGNLLDLADRFKSSDPSALQTHPLPTEVGTTAVGASVLYLLEEAQAALDVFRGIEPTQDDEAVVPAQVTVSVLNGSLQAGQAAGTDEILSEVGFKVANTGNATGSPFETTTIRYGPDERARAELLASYLQEPPALVADPSVSSVDVVLVTGLDYQGALSAPRPTEVAPPPTASPPAEAPEPNEPTC